MCSYGACMVSISFICRGVCVNTFVRAYVVPYVVVVEEVVGGCNTSILLAVRLEMSFVLEEV